MITTISALFVHPQGPYINLLGDCWTETRDARRYAGPNPVIAHPPCARWSRFWRADGSDKPGHDDGCFASALESVRRWGGIIEHPEASYAWHAFSLGVPTVGCWSGVLLDARYPVWTTCVAQRNYGHDVRKLTWLLFVGRHPKPLDWSTPRPQHIYIHQPRRCQGGKSPPVQTQSAMDRQLTPRPFALMLIDLVRSGCLQD